MAFALAVGSLRAAKCCFSVLIVKAFKSSTVVDNPTTIA